MSTTWGWETTTDEVLAGVDLRGQVAVVTGATTGLGRETARALAAHGAHVVCTGRTQAKADAAVASLGSGSGSGSGPVSGEGIALELDSLDSIRAATDLISERHPRIDILIANAGVMACPLGRTAEGFELQFGTNHLGHFLFTGRLLPALSAAPAARIVNLSSGGHRITGIDWEDPNFEHRSYDKWQAYGQSKTANVLHALELQHRYGPRGILALSVHPGVIGTDLARHLSAEDMAGLQRSTEVATRRKSIPAGAATSVWAATAPELAEHGGAYLEDCGIGSPAPYAVDPVAAARLWALSEDLVGEHID
jgi:NAD(P)-dependent dehydrogenase (short-subunit alcohol dehydrogenase family)